LIQKRSPILGRNVMQGKHPSVLSRWRNGVRVESAVLAEYKHRGITA